MLLQGFNAIFDTPYLVFCLVPITLTGWRARALWRDLRGLHARLALSGLSTCGQRTDGSDCTLDVLTGHRAARSVRHMRQTLARHFGLWLSELICSLICVVLTLIPWRAYALWYDVATRPAKMHSVSSPPLPSNLPSPPLPAPPSLPRGLREPRASKAAREDVSVSDNSILAGQPLLQEVVANLQRHDDTVRKRREYTRAMQRLLGWVDTGYGSADAEAALLQEHLWRVEGRGVRAEGGERVSAACSGKRASKVATTVPVLTGCISGRGECNQLLSLFWARVLWPHTQLVGRGLPVCVVVRC